MTDQADLLAQFSNALATRAEAAKNAVVAIRLAHERHMTGMVWRPEIVVASEQSLPRKDDFELIGAGGSALTARMAGRKTFGTDWYRRQAITASNATTTMSRNAVMRWEYSMMA